ncbi:hypothetical protein TRIATDRAFT_2771, partial [Trichoderma atroviride IMI 206040]
YPQLPDERSIRLIKIHGAASPLAEIHVDLVAVPLDGAPSYDALSYSWDNQPLDKVIYANGRKFPVTKNARSAIQRLRLTEGQSRYLWVDAICIDQKNIAEKSSQVAMMAEIYQKATRVNIWLGDGNDSSDFILRWYSFITLPFAPISWIERKAIRYSSSPEWPTDSLLGLTHFPQALAELISGVMGSFMLPHIPMPKDGEADLESRTYWKRVWTIQESNINPNCFVYCGSAEPLHCEIYLKAAIITALLHARLDPEWFRTYGLHISPRSDNPTGSRKYDEALILSNLCYKQSTLAVDKVFSMGYMLPASFGTIQQDYSLTTAEVYTKAGHSLLNAYGNVKFMRFACHSDRNDGLPSWVPSWTTTTVPWWMDEHSNAEPLPSPAIFSRGSNESVLKIKGLRIATVTATAGVLLPKVSVQRNMVLDIGFKDDFYMPIACAILKTWVEKVGAMDKGDVYLNQFFTMISNSIGYRPGQVRLSTALESFELATDHRSYSIKPRPSVKQSVEFDLMQIMTQVSGQCCFLTTTGQVGLSIAEPRKGDEVVLLTGESLPYIIRKSLDRPGSYILVSPCFLSNGRLTKPWQKW